MVESYQDQDDIGVNDENLFYDAVLLNYVSLLYCSEDEDWSMSDEAMDVAVNSDDDQRTSTPPPVPWMDVNYNKLDRQMRYKYYGDFVRLWSFSSSTSSSPDLQPMGQPSTSMDGGDSFWSSPDVNAKAGIFISKGKDKWKIEQENTVKKTSGTSFINIPRKTNLNPMKSHLYP
ncbi:formin-like protein 20 [Artemisia annua]|uniref:Formin-like protein 20 n=1 Tax=Artemisia annua TaxID=35608 RepID=A0A2U1LXP4_ARTAN|nr:formin-like protein 20 [Artemisia annua]